MPESVSTSRGRISVDRRMVIQKQKTSSGTRTTRIPLRAVTSVETAARGVWPLLWVGVPIIAAGFAAMVLVHHLVGIGFVGVGSLLVASFILVRRQSIQIASPTAKIGGKGPSKGKLDRFADEVRARLEENAPMDSHGSEASRATARIRERVDG